MNSFDIFLIYDYELVEDVLNKINNNGINFALIINSENKLLGVLTDGDLRRHFLKGFNLKDKVTLAMNNKFVFATNKSTPQEIRNYFEEGGIKFLPIVDDKGKIIDLLSKYKFEKELIFKTPAILMAGGLGKRLGNFTLDCPKPMIKIKNKPILEIVLENCIASGLNNFYISVNFLKEKIINYFGDGSKWGVQISYLEEKERLGTAGSLSLLPKKIESPIFLMNGDVLTKCNLNSLINSHIKKGAYATVVTKEYETNIPFGVIKTKGDLVISFEEKPNYIHNVNTGLYVLNSEIYRLVPAKKYFDMPDLLALAMKKKYKVNIFSSQNYWLDIGHPETLVKAQKEWGIT